MPRSPLFQEAARLRAALPRMDAGQTDKAKSALEALAATGPYRQTAATCWRRWRSPPRIMRRRQMARHGGRRPEAPQADRRSAESLLGLVASQAPSARKAVTAKVAIIGRPNVGKSTLFNRLVGRKLALVDDKPGVTRDRREGEARLGDLAFTIIDTAGLEEGDPETLAGRMRAQTEAALADCDAILFMIDARAGLTPPTAISPKLCAAPTSRSCCSPTRPRARPGATARYEAFGLGLGEPIPLSAEHGEGLGRTLRGAGRGCCPTRAPARSDEDGRRSR